MISNSVAIQTGTNPATASIQFYWRWAADGSPAAIVPDEPDERHWFGNGVRVGDRLVLFLNRVRSTTSGIGFESVGWVAWMVDNPDADPPQWRMNRLGSFSNPLGVLVGFAAVLVLDEHVYAFGSQDPVKSHPIHAVRWPSQQVGKGDLTNPEWWAGDRLGWVPDASLAPRQPLFDNGASELSIHRDAATGRFLAFQTQGFGPADVMIRTAPTLTGPWSGPGMVYRPSEYDRPNVMIYSAKAHPELTGADLVLTYATNTFRFDEHFSDPDIYYPRFVRLARCAGNGPINRHHRMPFRFAVAVTTGRPGRTELQNALFGRLQHPVRVRVKAAKSVSWYPVKRWSSGFLLAHSLSGYNRVYRRPQWPPLACFRQGRLSDQYSTTPGIP